MRGYFRCATLLVLDCVECNGSLTQLSHVVLKAVESLTRVEDSKKVCELRSHNG